MVAAFHVGKVPPALPSIREELDASLGQAGWLLSTINLAGGAPGRSIMVGDSKTDIDTAKAAGVPVVAVDFGYTDVHVSLLGPDHVISHFDSLWDAVELLSPALAG